MTNHWIDIKNSDCIFVIGANPAENHPASMLYINEARENGAPLIVVDPRITRTAAKADIYASLRSGTDIIFLGGIMNHIIQNGLYHREYVAHYTNAATLIDPDFKGPVDLDGLFSGYDPDTRSYDRSTWKYQLDDKGNPKRDLSLEDPNCVFQILKRHYARYTPGMVERICGTPKEEFLQVAAEYAKTGQPGKAGTILYAMGQTQHTVGSQNVRSLAMLQLLLGNIGIPGGGVNALRGESNVQGSTDMALLFHIIPGYNPTPSATKHPTLKDYNDKAGKGRGGYWVNTPKFITSMLKAWWGDKATAENDFCYDYLAKLGKGHPWISLVEDMYAGEIKGAIGMGMNPAVSGPNVNFERKALEKLDFLVMMEIFDTETTSFWRAPGVNPSDIKTEVFLLPAADALENAGSIVTSGRLIQWRPKVAEPPGEAMPDIWILDRMYRAIYEEYKDSTDPKDRPILDLNWDYGPEVDVEKIAREINGYFTQDVKDDKGQVVGKAGDLVPLFTKLRDDGSTACGNWLYTGYFYPLDDGQGNTLPASKRRGTQDPGGLGTYPFWAYVWPANRHIIYNRCSADLEGKPWNKDKALIWWDSEKKRWVGYDVPDFAATKAPDAPGGDSPFIMKSDGKGWLFGALNEGPIPEHYEPVESPVDNPMSSQQTNPCIKIWDTDSGQPVGDNVGNRNEYPIVATTYRVAEHWQAGAMSRNLPWLAEAQPDMFVELSKELAKEKSIKGGDEVIVSSARGQVRGVAIVTARFKPFRMDGREVHQIGLPWHYGWKGIATGDSANFITPHVGDANTMIPEYKAFLVNIRKAE